MADERLHVNHAVMVKGLSKSGADIAAHLSENPTLMHLLHMVTCIQGEAGELFDTVKKMAIYGQELDVQKVENIAEELGDLEFYMEGTRQAISDMMLNAGWRFGITREMSLRNNIQKLEKRYGELYSDEAAKERADKA